VAFQRPLSAVDGEEGLTAQALCVCCDQGFTVMHVNRVSH